MACLELQGSTDLAELYHVCFELLFKTTLLPLAGLHTWIPTIVQKSVAHKSRGVFRRKQYGDVCGKMFQIDTMQLLPTLPGLLEFYLHQSGFQHVHVPWKKSMERADDGERRLLSSGALNNPECGITEINSDFTDTISVRQVPTQRVFIIALSSWITRRYWTWNSKPVLFHSAVINIWQKCFDRFISSRLIWTSSQLNTLPHSWKYQ